MLTQEQKDTIHRLFTCAIGERPEGVTRHIIFRGLKFSTPTHWGCAVAQVMEHIPEIAPSSKAVISALSDLERALRAAEKKLMQMEREFPNQYAGIEEVSTSPVFRQRGDRGAFGKPRTAQSPIEEVRRIIDGVWEEKYANLKYDEKHAVPMNLVKFWCHVTGEGIKPSPDSRLVQMLEIATGLSRDTLSKRLKRHVMKKGGQKREK